MKKIIQNIEAVAELHAVLSSPRGNYLRRRLLHALRRGLTLDEIEQIRKEFGVEEFERHINKLALWGLIEPVKSTGGIPGYLRTDVGEEALNAVRDLASGGSVRKSWPSSMVSMATSMSRLP